MLKRVIFDFDGTLADTFALCMTCFHKAWEPYAGRSLTDKEITDTFGLPEEGMVTRLIPGPWEQPLADLYRCYEELHPTLCPSLFPGVKELLTELKHRGIHLDLITGKGAPCCKISLGYFGLEDTFEIIIPGNPRRRHKEDAIRQILEQTGTLPEEAVYIGDVVSDITASQKAGIDCLSAAWSETADLPALEQANPGLVFSSVEKMKEYLLKQ